MALCNILHIAGWDGYPERAVLCNSAVEEVAVGEIVFAILVQGFLAHRKTHPPRTLPQAYV